jgi:hypothetical protein
VYEGDFLVAGTVGPLCPAAVFAGLKGERVPFAALALSPLMPWLFFARGDSKEIHGWLPLSPDPALSTTLTTAHAHAPPHTHHRTRTHRTRTRTCARTIVIDLGTKQKLSFKMDAKKPVTALACDPGQPQLVRADSLPLPGVQLQFFFGS